jgi:hypothetical protein
MSFVSNGGKFKLCTVLNGLIFPTPTQPRISFERPILFKCNAVFKKSIKGFDFSVIVIVNKGDFCKSRKCRFRCSPARA